MPFVSSSFDLSLLSSAKVYLSVLLSHPCVCSFTYFLYFTLYFVESIIQYTLLVHKAIFSCRLPFFRLGKSFLFLVCSGHKSCFRGREGRTCPWLSEEIRSKYTQSILIRNSSAITYISLVFLVS